MLASPEAASLALDIIDDDKAGVAFELVCLL